MISVTSSELKPFFINERKYTFLIFFTERKISQKEYNVPIYIHHLNKGNILLTAKLIISDLNKIQLCYLNIP